MRLWRRGADARDQGAVAVLVAFMAILMLVMVAIAVDTGRWYVEAARVQSAADAAAMGGVTWLPDDYNSGRTSALAVSADNGFPDGSAANCDINNANPPAGTSCVYVAPGGRPSQLQVSVSSVVPNVFGSIVGNPTTKITRTAIADFEAPTLMGSPCNALGNEPLSTTGAAQPVGTVIPDEAQGGYPTCQTAAGFWLRMAGPWNSKSNGDRYATRRCGASGTYNCNNGSNSNVYDSTTQLGEYRPDGYFFIVRVLPEAVGEALTMQIYDPAYIDTGVSCANSITATQGMNDYVPVSVTPNSSNSPYRAADRYGTLTTSPWTTGNPNPYCVGDDDGGGESGGSEGYFTSYILRRPTSTYNPVNGAPEGGCTKQFGFKPTAAPTTNELTKTNPSYNDFLARTYHQWVDLCTFQPDVAGDYYLQVRTNLSKATAGVTTLTGSGNTSIVYPTDGGANTGNPIAYPVSSLVTTNTYGHNRFALRIATSPAGPTETGRDVAVSGYERFPIFAQVQSPQEFNLIQVPEDALGNDFTFSLFDLSDFSGTATLRVVGPTCTKWDVHTNTGPGDPCPTGTGLTSCTITGVTTTTGNNPSACTFKLPGGSNNGKLGKVNVPIPDDYECTSAGTPGLGDCWMRVQLTLGTGANEDTTWDAGINGDPVRLVE